MSSPSSSAPTSNPIQPPHGQAPVRVLVIDDDTSVREVSQEYLAGKFPGGGVESAVDGAGGIAAAARLDPHLVICDYNLPDLEGPVVCRRIREARRGSVPKFIIVTGNDDPAVREKVLADGIDACLIKPYSMRELYTLAVSLLPGGAPGPALS